MFLRIARKSILFEQKRRLKLSRTYEKQQCVFYRGGDVVTVFFNSGFLCDQASAVGAILEKRYGDRTYWKAEGAEVICTCAERALSRALSLALLSRSIALKMDVFRKCID